MDMQILRDLFDGCASASEVLGGRRRLPHAGAGGPAAARADEGRLARQRHGVAPRLGRDRAEPPARLAPLRPAPEQPDHQARHSPAAHRGPPDAGAARRRRHRLVARLEDQLLGAAGGGRPGPRPHPLPRDDGPPRAQHVRPAPAVPDRRQLRRHLRHRRNAAAQPQRRAARAARAAIGLARGQRHGPARARRVHRRRDVERRRRHHACPSRRTATAPSGSATGSSPAPTSCATRRAAP